MVNAFIVNAENTKKISSKGQFFDLSNLASFQKLTTSAKEQSVIDDIVYTIPLGMTVYIMAVNQSLLERYGLNVPQNYDEFLHCCKVLREDGITPISINRWHAMAVPVMARGLYPIYQAENKKELIQGLNSGEIKIGDYMIDGFRMFEIFLKEGYYGENLVMEEVDMIRANTQDKEDFLNGKTAFRFFATNNLDDIILENEDKCVFVGIPMLPDGVITLPSISTRLCVNANSTYLDETIAFVNFMAEKRIEVIKQKAMNDLSPFHSTMADTKNSGNQTVIDLMEAGHQIPIEDMNVHFGYWDNTRALCLAMVGGMTAEEAAAEFNRIQMEELQSYTDMKRGEKSEGLFQ